MPDITLQIHLSQVSSFLQKQCCAVNVSEMWTSRSLHTFYFCFDISACFFSPLWKPIYFWSDNDILNLIEALRLEKCFIGQNRVAARNNKLGYYFFSCSDRQWEALWVNKTIITANRQHGGSAGRVSTSQHQAFQLNHMSRFCTCSLCVLWGFLRVLARGLPNSLKRVSRWKGFAKLPLGVNENMCGLGDLW